MPGNVYFALSLIIAVTAVRPSISSAAEDRKVKIPGCGLKTRILGDGTPVVVLGNREYPLCPSYSDEATDQFIEKYLAILPPDS
jgi:hypothetical protein